MCSLLGWSKAGSTSWPRSSRIDSNAAKCRFFGMLILGHVLSWFLQNSSKSQLALCIYFQRDNNAMKIFVGGIASGTTEDDLRNYFSAYGTVITVYCYIHCWNELEVCKFVAPSSCSVHSFFFICYNLTWLNFALPPPPNWIKPWVI